MTDPLALLANLRRPALLIRAARHGMAEYRRSKTLRRILDGEPLPGPFEALASLLRIEAELERTRRDGAASYSVSFHIEVLIALMSEARLASQQC